MVKIADVGMKVEWKDVKHDVPLSGVVRKIYNQSVLVDLDESEYIATLELNEATIVAHKRYTIVKENNSYTN